MKIVLIHPNHKNSTDSRLDPPLGLLYIARNLLNHGYNVEICDLSGIESYNIPYADIYGITVYITSIQETKNIISKCKEVNPNCKIVVGGAHPTSRPYDFSYVDHVVMGYGERTMIDIVENKVTGHVIKGKIPTNMFLFPAYELIDPNSYNRRINNQMSLPLLTSRGCFANCAFCGLDQMHKTLNYKMKFAPTDVVISHMRKIKEMGINAIAIQDDIFTLKPSRLYKILDEIKKLNINFRCMGRAGVDKEETYARLADAGIEQISWGIESGSQYILDRMKKDVTVQDNYNVIKWAKKYGINTRAFFILGFPGETRETIEETKKFIIESDPDQYFVSSFIPYPGTDVGDNPEKYGIINMSDNYDDYYQISKDGTGGMTIDTKWLSRYELRELEFELRDWLKKNKDFRGNKQDYEKKLYNLS